MKVLLVVDDDPAIRRLVPRMLKDSGIAVLGAADTAEASATLSARPVDAVLLDVVLGAENGWETLRLLRQASDVPVVMMTGATADEETLADTRAMGAQGLLAKPFGRRELLESLSAVLGAA